MFAYSLKALSRSWQGFGERSDWFGRGERPLRNSSRLHVLMYARSSTIAQ